MTKWEVKAENQKKKLNKPVVSEGVWQIVFYYFG